MASEAFHKKNNAVIKFVIDYRDSDPLLATMQSALTELAVHSANVSLDLSKRLMSVDMAAKVLRVLLDYIEQEYPEEYKALPPASGFTCA